MRALGQCPDRLPVLRIAACLSAFSAAAVGLGPDTTDGRPHTASHRKISYWLARSRAWERHVDFTIWRTSELILSGWYEA